MSSVRQFEQFVEYNKEESYMAYKIYLSPSNQSGNKYAYGGVSECDVCNRIADATKQALERCGFVVKKAPKGQDMYVSIRESNNWGSDLHMPIHTNAGGGNGTMCMVYRKATENMKYATPIYKAVQSVTPGKIDYGIREYPELAELANTSAIAVYTEVDFHDNVEIAKWLINNVSIVGEAFCKGVCDGFGVAYVAKSNVKSTNTSSTTTAKTQTKQSNATSTVKSDLNVFLDTARSYIGKNGAYVCKQKLGYRYVVDWCALAISAIMKDCGFMGKYQGGVYSYASDNAREDDGKYGVFFKKGTKTVQPGDLIMFRYSTLNPIDQYSASHVGIVEKADGGTLTTLEGNVDGGSDWAETSSFKRKTRYLSDGSVYGFFRPYWLGSTTTKSTNTTGNNSKNTATFEVKITSDDGVNLRSGAGTQYSVRGAVPFGTQLCVTDVKSVSGVEWGYVRFAGTTGWICLSFAERLNTSSDVYYTVKKGDTLSSIARKFGVRVVDICRMNNISNPDVIYGGTKLKIR